MRKRRSVSGPYLGFLRTDFLGSKCNICQNCPLSFDLLHQILVRSELWHVQKHPQKHCVGGRRQTGNALLFTRGPSEEKICICTYVCRISNTFKLPQRKSQTLDLRIRESIFSFYCSKTSQYLSTVSAVFSNRLRDIL